MSKFVRAWDQLEIQLAGNVRAPWAAPSCVSVNAEKDGHAGHGDHTGTRRRPGATIANAPAAGHAAKPFRQLAHSADRMSIDWAADKLDGQASVNSTGVNDDDIRPEELAGYRSRFDKSPGCHLLSDRLAVGSGEGRRCSREYLVVFRRDVMAI